MTALRSLLFNLAYFLWSVFMHVVCLPLLLAPASWVWAAGHRWIDGTLFLLRVLCGLGARELGLENLPKGPAIVAAKHQSAWETLFLSRRLGRPAFVLKRELLGIPLFGWFIRKVGMVAVDRAGKAAALKRMVRDANQALGQGRRIVIFPEGTRVAPGTHRPYQPGIAALYGQLNVPVVPVALNSGLYWGRKAWVKKPGRILIEYLPPIPPGLDRKAFMAELEHRLEPAANALLDRSDR
ncbi:MAG TPA: lysophospholipid acyltransferase family protein [Dongiaceae bacterium]|nr:lysophospholipid acyltransferase family protein [Dongiaceae bacterium]